MPDQGAIPIPVNGAPNAQVTGALPNGQTQPWMGAIPYPNTFGVPPQLSSMPIQGTGGYVSKGAQFLSGLDAGSNFMGNLQQSKRGTKDYKDTLNSQGDTGNAGAQIQSGGQSDPAAQTQAHTDFISSLGESLKHAGSAISGFFGGGNGGGGAIPAPPAAGGSSQLLSRSQAGPQVPPSVSSTDQGTTTTFQQGGVVPSAIPPQSQVPQNGPNGQGSPAQFQQGGPVPAARPLPFLATPSPGAMGVNTSHQALPGVSGYADGGAVDPGAASPQTAPAMPAQPDQPPPGNAVMMSSGSNAQQAALDNAKEAFAQHLHDGSLDDQGAPHGQQGIPTNPQQVLQSVANNPAAAKGIPEDSPKGSQPHSLTPDYWDRSDQLIAKAAQSAALAGRDPNQVTQNLEAIRTSFIQSHFVRNLASANVASMNGDQTALEQSLRHAYYYLPNGEDLKLSRGDDGNLKYQDPFHPLDANGKPNLVDVTPEHIQLLGQAAMNPMNFAAALQQYRMAPINAQMAQQEVGAKVTTAQGTYLRGQGVAAEGQARLREAASTNVKNLSAAQLDQARAAAAQFAQQRWMLRMQELKLDPTALKGAQQAAQGVEDMAMGKTAIPIKDDQGNLNINPNAGKMGYDPSRVPKELHMNPLELSDNKALAGDIYMTNSRTGMTPQQASQFALQMHAAKGKTHPGANGSKDPDAYVHKESGEAGLWNPATKKYDKVKIGSQSVSGLLDNGGRMPEDAFISAALGNTAPASGIPAQQGSVDAGQDFPGDNGASSAGNPTS